MLSVGASAVMDICGATLKSDFGFSEAHISSRNLFKWHLKKSLILDPRVKVSTCDYDEAISGTTE